MATWTDEEIVERWLKIAKLAKSRDGKVRPIHPLRCKVEMAKPGRIEELRSRMSAPSWFMATLCENVGRRSNREDGCKGCFWEDRFGCRELLDEASILVCGIYIDLNQIRAGEAVVPEESTHTSAFDRIAALKRHGSISPLEAPDGWLCELTINEREPTDSAKHTTSRTRRRASDKGMLPISVESYLELLDATGRLIRNDKKGAIPSSLAPILERLGLRRETWTDLVRNYHQWFGHLVGHSQALAERAKQAGRRWYRGKSHCATHFG